MFFFQVPDEPLYMATASGTKIFPNQTLDTAQVKGTKTRGAWLRGECFRIIHELKIEIFRIFKKIFEYFI